VSNSIRNLKYLRSLSSRDFPDLGVKLYEALSDMARHHENLAQQVNGNSTGEPTPPPPVDSVKVTGQNGHFNIAITDNNPVFRDVHYYVEHADNPQFANPQIIHLGHTRNHNVFLGSVTRYWRAYSAYASSAASAPAYHGGQASPQAVNGGGSVGGPALQASQGSGTGTPGQGLSGPGPVPFRSATGVPPTR
jgi:hypothetical protein